MILECTAIPSVGMNVQVHRAQGGVRELEFVQLPGAGGHQPAGGGRGRAAIRAHRGLQPGRAGDHAAAPRAGGQRRQVPGRGGAGGQRRQVSGRGAGGQRRQVSGAGAPGRAPAGPSWGPRRCTGSWRTASPGEWGRCSGAGSSRAELGTTPLHRELEDSVASYNNDLYVDQVVEGVYSMEGSIAPLRGLVELKKRLGLQLYLDEAHSVGAIGPRGRGATDHCGVRPQDVDVLMGTFTKSFGAAGGYVAGSAALIRALRARGHGHSYATSMSPPVAAQVLWALRSIDSPAGLERIQRLRENTAYFRDRLRSMGVVMYGAAASPVVPVLVYTFSKMAATVERLARAGLATVGVGFPATPLNQARIRFCLSAAHTREQLEACAEAVKQVVDELGLHYSRRAIH
ncbi:unnamed protein product [Chilo suppressalis]|uniref:serine C-palmitoyltransferase n=1 Tax=Chilo suppressalis TaxID=168631 RepID=A0ABN8BIE7_CHISP|nr:unnamed protein product [Chilo suppressalis]